jgi:uncharacterized protein (DUF1501 family)
MWIHTRRDFLRATLRSVTALGAAGAMSKFAEMNALATNAPGYQALVCIFLSGGNDGHNSVVPITTTAQNYSLYQSGRQSLAIPQSSLMPVNNGNDVYGLHPQLTEIAALYNSGKAAIVANVGMLVKAIDRNAYLAGATVPSALFSHSDQTTQWQSASPNETLNTGWGGRVMDALPAQNNGAQFPAITTTSASGLFCTGQQNLPAVVPVGGIPTLANLPPGSSRSNGLQALLTFDNGLQLVQAGNGVLNRGNNYANALSSLLANAKINTPFPGNNPLASQLLTVAQMISVRSQLGMTRQIFFCQLDGFDTHGGQLPIQVSLLQQLSQAVSAFFQATQELAVDQQVTTFTASEFGRTLTPNGSGGSDHAWGNHHFIIGSGVKGGSIYGNFPVLAVGGQYDASNRGAFIPTTAVDQYGATLAQWFGVTTGMTTVFPNLVNFQTQNLGFLG